MKIEEVSAVDKAATRKKFLLIKKDTEEEFEKRTLDDVLDNKEARKEMWDTVDAFYTAINDTMYNSELSEMEKANQIQASSDQLANRMNEIAPDLAKRFDVEKIVENVQKRLSDEGGENMPELKDLLEKIEDEDIRKGIEAHVEELMKEEEVVEGVEEEEVIDKSELPEELRKRFEDLEKKAAVAEEIAKKEREKRLDIEFNKRAKEFATVGEVDKIASILKRVSEDEELQFDVEEILKSAQERLEKTDLFKETGDSGSNASDAEEAIEKKTKELMKSDTSLTYAQAQRKILQENPDLYNEYTSQNAQ